MKSKSFVITLCHECKAGFENAGTSYIRRVNPKQAFKEKCTYCNIRSGYDYKITPKDRKEKR